MIDYDILFSNSFRSLKGNIIRELYKWTNQPGFISFAGGNPDPSTFPNEALAELTRKNLLEKGTQCLQYGVSNGVVPLREYVAEMLTSEGVPTKVENVVITTGSQQTMDLLAKAVINPGDIVLVESPTYVAALKIFSIYGANIIPVDADDDGMLPESLEEKLSAGPVKLIYMIPNFQNPTGLTYSVQNREAVYHVIRDKNVILIEDDPYGELRFDGKTLPYIAAGRFDNCILLGSFSKTATPGMRVGYLVCKNAELLETIAAAKESSDVHTSVLSQYVLYDYLTHNDYDGHIAEIRALYESQTGGALREKE